MKVASEIITVLRTASGWVAQKTFFADQPAQAYDAGWLFTFERLEVDSLEDFASALAVLENDPTAFIIRGQPLPHVASGSVVHRRCRGEGAAFAPAPTRLVCVDVDSIVAPEGVSPCSAQAVEHVIRQLPTEFHNAAYVRQFSSSAGLSGQKIKVHLWWWLAGPYSDEQLRHWAQSTGVADPALYNPVQPHYVARPAFDGMSDPFDGMPRVAYVHKPCAEVTLRLPERYSTPRPSGVGGNDTVSEISREDSGKAIDGREELQRNIRWHVLQKRLPKDRDAFFAMVWEEFSKQAILTPTSLSNNSYTAESVRTNCDRDWDRWGAIIPAPKRTLLSAEEAAAQMRDAIHRAVTGPGRTAIKATPGLGKSVATAAELMSLPDIQSRYVEVYPASKNQQAEWAERVAAAASEAGLDIPVIPIYGRDSGNCPKSELAAELARSEIPIAPSLCRGTARGVTFQCEHFESCKYRAQFANSGPAIRIFSHAHLPTSRPKELTRPDLVIVDEAFASSLTDVGEANLLASLRSVRVGLWLPLRRVKSTDVSEFANVAEAERVLMQVEKAIQSRSPLLEELRSRGVTSRALTDAADALRARMPLPSVHPGKRASEVRREVAASPRRHYLMAAKALSALGIELSTARLSSHAVKYVPERGDAKLCVHRDPARLRDVETVLILDADFEAEMVRPLLSGVECVSIDAKQNARIIQVEDRSLSKAFLGLTPGETINDGAIKRLKSEILKAPGERKLVVTYKALIPHLRALVPSAEFIHFGGLRGTNAFENCDTALIIGRNFPPSSAVEDMARALYYADPDPLLISDPFPMRHEAGTGVLISYDFLDARLQSIMRSIREAEIRQAVGRLRLVHAAKRKDVLIYSSQPTGMAVDALIRFEPKKGEVLFSELGGVLPLNPRDLARLAGPDHFPRGERQAKEWRDHGINTGGGIIDLFMRSPVFVGSTTYRRKHAPGRASDVLVDLMVHTHPERTLPRLLAGPDEDPSDIQVQPLPWEEVPDYGVPGVYRLRLKREAS